MNADKIENLLITGDFMKAAGVTRNTLIHYDNIGLLKPVATNERGDRFYSPLQISKVIFIKVVQVAGVELKVIKQWLEDLSRKEVLSDFDNKIALIDQYKRHTAEEIINFHHSYLFTKKMSYCMRLVEFLDPKGPVVVKHLKLKGYFSYKICSKPVINNSNEYYEEFLKFIEAQSRYVRDGFFPIISHCEKKSFEEGYTKVSAFSCYTFSKSGTNVDKYSNVPVLLLRRIGDTLSIESALNEFRTYLNEHPEYELMDNVSFASTYVSVGDEDLENTDRIFFAALKKRETPFAPIPLGLSESFQPANSNSMVRYSGEFIKRSKITRNTLNLYEQKGLIKPYLIKENGYKMYGPLQSYQCFMIKILKQAGYTLEECKELLNHNMSDYTAYKNHIVQMRRQHLRVKKKIEELKESHRTILEIKHLLFVLKQIEKNEGNVVSINRKIYYELISTDPCYGRKFNEDLNEMFRRSVYVPKYFEFPVGSVVGYDNDKIKLFNVVNPTMLDEAAKERWEYYIKGDYYFVFHSIESEDIPVWVHEMSQKINAQNEYKVSGDVINLFLIASGENTENPKLSAISLFPVVRV